MSNDGTSEFLILRELNDPISKSDLHEAAEASGEALEELREEGSNIRWESSEVLRNENDGIVGTFCRYEAESEDVIEEHAERAGLPATKITRRGEPLEGE
ncbi:DUF4242 domain-containing protein [Haladaptatus sp. CMAA 1911]|uniref:DUF4242 domain-containing protein n=1 Tax=unclassified Haladaptatus TaxID=2622732 RepID=UPI00375447A6